MANPTLSLLVQQAARRVREEVQRSLGDRLLEVRVFGSQARGEAHEESDLDLLVLVDEEESALSNDIYEIVSRVEAELVYQLPISPCIMSHSRYRGLLERELLFAQEIERDGVLI